MNFFKQPSVQDLVKDVYLRKAIAEQTVAAVKEVQAEAIQNTERKLMQGDVSNRFCEVIEAIFLHGSKGRLSKMMSEVFGSSKLPKPDFWALVMLYSHRDDLQTLSALNQINTDIGRCRAWVRLVINDSTLSSFLVCISQDSKTLPSFYRSSAFLRDPESVAVVVRLLSSLAGHVKFCLPLNVASLNIWQKQPLLLSGLWKEENGCDVGPVMRGVDVDDFFIQSTAPKMKTIAKDIKRDDEDVSTFQLSTSIAQEIHDALEKEKKERALLEQHAAATSHNDSSSESEVRQLLDELHLDASEGFKKVDDYDEPELQCSLSESQMSTGSGQGSNTVEDVKDTNSTHTIGSSSGLIDVSSGWSSPFSDQTILVEGTERTEFTAKFDEPVTPQREASFDSILNSYTNHIAATPPVAVPVGTPELSNMLAQVYGPKLIKPDSDEVLSDHLSPENCPDESTGENEEDDDDEEDFEVVPKPEKEDQRTQDLLEDIGKIPREYGLDQQNFECFGCKCSIGMIFGPYKKCSLDGHLYCKECFEGDEPAEEHVIPARLIHNWDLKTRPVCRFNKRFLIRNEQEPLLDVRELNPVLYSVVPELAVIQSLRRQLGFLRLYLFSCSDSVGLQLKKMVWPREYLYEHVHLYSTLDLLSVPSGSLQRHLEKACQFAIKHVLSCQLCGQKGFICELCSDFKVIFPFNMTETHFCELCSALYHKKCMEERANSCPKCERRRVREAKLAAYDYNEDMVS